MDRYAAKFINRPNDLMPIIMFLANLVEEEKSFTNLFTGSAKIMNRPLPVSLKESLTKESTLY